MTHKEIAVEFRGDAQQVAVIRLMRSSKRNALSDGLILGLRDVFQNLPASVRAAVVDGDGPHFCAGLDLSELSERDASQGVLEQEQAFDCDLIVMGKHGKNLLEELIVGSVTKKVLAESQCDVLVSIHA